MDHNIDASGEYQGTKYNRVINWATSALELDGTDCEHSTHSVDGVHLISIRFLMIIALLGIGFLFILLRNGILLRHRNKSGKNPQGFEMITNQEHTVMVVENGTVESQGDQL